ncbi:MAG: hypothetical protein NC311_13070 [Muribaculaceae bacterium]|nr:hypothetical protein [Muribaculaceae bacterium]
MAVKRSFSLNNQKFCSCLTCGAQIVADGLKDNTVYTCGKCGQKMTVDRYENRATLTVIERQDIRRRIPPEIGNVVPQQKAEIKKLLQENSSLKIQLYRAEEKIKELRREARDWERAADGLACMIEEMKEKEDAHKRFDFLFGGYAGTRERAARREPTQF